MQYRSEIDGLRALAVIPVILFHAGFSFFSGGFVGVDVFFVISGYLITSLLMEDILLGRFSLLTFYERRARRILPALFLVMLVCLPFAWMWMLPSQMKDFSQSLIAVTLFASNILFWMESGYFEAASEEKPLLHTWSLAVEEQFYLFFPLLLLLLWRLGSKNALRFIIGLALCSFAFGQWQKNLSADAAFYLSPARVWELLAGSIAALIVKKQGVRSHNLASICGLLLIIAAIVLFDQKTPFPSLYSLMPVLGTVLIILFAGEKTLCSRLLRLKLCVGIGLISYSAYLWHQPLFAFARIRSIDPPSMALMFALSLLALLLAGLSWKYVETPFRAKNRFSRRQLFSACLAVSAFFIIIGLVGYLNDGKINKNAILPPNITWESLMQRIASEGPICNRNEKIPAQHHVLGCTAASLNSSRNLVLLGDSHSVALSYALRDYATSHDYALHWLAIEGCENLPHSVRDKKKPAIDCEKGFQELLTYIRQLNADVIVLNRWTMRMYPIDNIDIAMPYKNAAGHVESMKYREYDIYKNGQFYRDEDSKAAALREYIQKLSEYANTVFLIYPIPETVLSISKINHAYWLHRGSLLQNLTTPIAEYDQRHAFVTRIFDQIKSDKIIRIRPRELFCALEDMDGCVIQKDGIPWYLDDDHISDAGAEKLINHIDSHLSH